MPVAASRSSTVTAKEQIILAAEELFAARGLDGVSMREIGAAAGNGNNSAVQYHFGSKEQLAQAIFEYRLPALEARRAHLVSAQDPTDLRSWLACYVLPILEQGEQDGSHYLGFIAMVQQHGHGAVFDRIPDEYQDSTRAFREHAATSLVHIPEPLRSHRIGQVLAYSVHAAAARERERAAGRDVLPFAVHVEDLLDGLAGFLTAAPSTATLASLEPFGARRPSSVAV